MPTAAQVESYKVAMTAKVFADLRKLPPPVYPRAMDALNRMYENPFATEQHPEKVENAEEGTYSSRVDQAYRIIWKHIKPNHVVICLIDKHDEAYRRAQRQTFTLEDGVVKVADIIEVGAKPEFKPGFWPGFNTQKGRVGKLFVGYMDKQLLALGADAELVLHLRTMDDISELERVESLVSQELFDRLLEIAIGEVKRPTVPDAELHKSIEKHQGGDALYQFVDSEEFKRALEGSMEEWMLFLAPFQRQLAYRRIAGPARIKGIAGSGKTVVAVHRAYQLAKAAQAQNSKVLFLTYGNKLPSIIEHLLSRLSNDPELMANRVECVTMHQWCRKFLVEQRKLINVDMNFATTALERAIRQVKPDFSDLSLWERPPAFFKDEISYSIKGRDVASLDAYLALNRSGRGTPLKDRERRAVFAVYRVYQNALEERGVCDFDDWILECLHLLQGGQRPTTHYAAAVVDEIQDFSEAMIRLIRCLVPEEPNDLFLVGDGLQRLYPGGYSLTQLGISVTGRSALLRRNYRNTHEIMKAAHQMMKTASYDDMEEMGAPPVEPEYSVRRGPVPVLRQFSSLNEEIDWISTEIEALKHRHGFRNEDICVLYRQYDPYKRLVMERLGGRLEVVELGKDAMTYFGSGAKHTTFDSAKGLEFKVVFIVGVTDGILVPKDDLSLEGIELEEYMARERRRLYVAMTRARDRLYLTYSRGQASRFLTDITSDSLQRL